MGQRSATESVAAVVQAFLSQRTWKQADLARHVEIGVPALRKALASLQSAGMPLTDEKDLPHVYWSVPRTWFPGGVLFPSSEVATLLRLLGRMPRGRDRERLIKIVLEATKSAAPSVVPPATTAAEEKHLTAIEDSSARKKPLRFRYYTASRGADGLREASVHAVFAGPPARFLAKCHRSDELKWFRVDNVSDASVDEQGTWRDDEGVEVALSSSLNGYRGPGEATAHSFFVKEPDARSVLKNVLAGMVVEEVRGGIRVRVFTTGMQILARYVVGLGGAAVAETEELRLAVRALALGALESTQPTE